MLFRVIDKWGIFNLSQLHCPNRNPGLIYIYIFWGISAKLLLTLNNIKPISGESTGLILAADI